MSILQAQVIVKFSCIDACQIAHDDVLAWWTSQKDIFLRLSLLSKTILAIPATSAPSERIFSTAGLTVNAKRSSLAPSTVDKVVFIHENAHFVNDSFE